MISRPVGNIRYAEGRLTAEVSGETTVFPRPCDFAEICGPAFFVFGEDNPEISACAVAASKLAASAKSFIPLRGEYGDFIVFAAVDGTNFSIAAMSRKGTTLTVRVEDAWDKLPPEKRSHSYTCKVLSGTIGNDTPAAFDIAPDARIFIDIGERDGFVMEFSPKETNR